MSFVVSLLCRLQTEPLAKIERDIFKELSTRAAHAEAGFRGPHRPPLFLLGVLLCAGVAALLLWYSRTGL